MSKALNLSLLASRNNLGNLGDAFISEGNNVAPSLGPLSAGVLSLNGVKQLPSQVGVNKSTGVVTISAEPHLGELDVPGWDKGQHITQWGTLQRYLSGMALSNRTIPATASYVRFVPRLGTAATGVLFASLLHPNGKIYSMAGGVGFSQSSWVSILDPVAETVTTIALAAGRGLGLDCNQAGVLAPNGKIFFCDSMPVVCFDPSNNSSTTFGYPAIQDGYEAGILAPNGKIYFIPNTATAVLRVDPDALTATTLGNMLIGGAESYSSACLAPNGKIYMTPQSKTNLVLLDPSNDTITQLTYPAGIFPGNNGRSSSALAPNGKIYIFSNNTTLAHAVLDPANNSVSTINAFPPASATPPFFTMCLAPDGKFYGGYTGLLSVAVVLDPSNNTQTTFNQISLGTSTAYVQVVMAPNGKIVYIPYNSTSYLILNKLNNNNFNINVCTNPMFNKL